MRAQHTQFSLATLLLAGSALGLAGSPSLGAGVILEINDASLTAYVPTVSSTQQAVRPLYEQRGVYVDGSWRAGASLPFASAGNSSNGPANGFGALNSISLAAGGYGAGDVDLRLPAEGFSWVIGRTYNAQQLDSSGAHQDSNGFQGRNWFQSSQPEIVGYNGGTDDKDMIYLVYGADRFIEFRRIMDGETATDTYRATNGAAGVIEFIEDGSGADLHVYTDQRGFEHTFFAAYNSESVDIHRAVGQLWKIEDPAGNVAYVGSTTKATAITSGYDTSGRIIVAYDTSDRRYTYTYTTLDSVARLTEVLAEIDDGDSTWEPTEIEVSKVEYEYYQTGDNTYGDNGNLQQVIITTPLSELGIESTRKKYYRYWKGAFDDSTNPGHPYALQYVVDFEGVRQFDYSDSTFDEDHKAASESILKPYASMYFEYDSAHRIDQTWANGRCGCGGADNGVYGLTYSSNGSYTDTAGYDTAWKSRTIVEQPDGTFATHYFDETGQPLSRVMSDGDPASASSFWVTKIVRASDALVESIHTPANESGYTHATGAITSSASAGMVTYLERVSSGDLDGFVQYTRFREGDSATSKIYRTKTEYDSASITIGTGGGAFDVVNPFVDMSRQYIVAKTSSPDSLSAGDASETATTVTFHTSTLAPEVRTTTLQSVATANNGSGTSNTSSAYFNLQGENTFTKDESGVISYSGYADGQMVVSVRDADTTKTASGEVFENVTIPTGFSSSGSPLHMVSEFAHDNQGRRTEVTSYAGTGSELVSVTHYTQLADERIVVLNVPRRTTSGGGGSTTYYGPVSYSVTHHAGGSEATGMIALSGNSTTTAITAWIDDTKSDAAQAVAHGSLARLSTTLSNESGGTALETRAYFDVPYDDVGMNYFLPGTDGTHYDATLLEYDEMGRRWRSESAAGTVSRTIYDELGRTISSWIGTNDNEVQFPGGDTSGTSDMVKLSETVYDSGNDGGNGYVTKRTAFVEDSTTDQRETTFEYDYRGNMLLATNPQAPHVFTEFDAVINRPMATGTFSSTASIVVGTDDPATETANRLGLNKTFYDELGRVYKTTRHEIDESDGSDDDNLETLTWFDERGQVIKALNSSLTKTAYDSLRRSTHRFVLATDNDTAYADADDVTGDIVVTESQTTFDADTGRVLMSAQIDRLHDDGLTGTTGPLDTNADNDDLLYTAANIEGRIQIMSMWYDDQGRMADTVQYGTNGGSNFERDGLAVPARSDTALRVTVAYNDDGHREDVTDPMGRVSRTEYDDLGRVTASIANYVNNVPSSATGDDDIFTRTAYTDGLRTKYWVDLNGDNVEDTDDQVTIYSYGTTKGVSGGAGDSEIGTGHLLYTVQYPDSSGGTDVVTFAYNALSEQVYKKDQAGNVLEYDYDTAGRRLHERASTIDVDFDDRVKRITMAYDSSGRVNTVTQYDNATAGSGTALDQVRYTYSNWDTVSKFEQDLNGLVGASGSIDDYEVGYAELPTTHASILAEGGNTVRRTRMRYYHNATELEDIRFIYFNTTNSLDNDLSRVTRVYMADEFVPVATYDYNGLGHLVGIDYNEPDVMWDMFGTSGTYPDLDRFNRVTSSRWTKDLATDVDFYDLDITYDRGSNITLVEDNILTGRDVQYTNDGLNRLTKAEEGTWNGTSITTRAREENWTLTQTGNWNFRRMDLNGDNNFSDANELDAESTFSKANEILTRDKDGDATFEEDLAHDEVGNLQNDGFKYKFVYDVWGRLVDILNRNDDSTVEEFEYNGLGYRTSWHYDVDGDATVEDTSDDPWFYFAYDENWRIVMTFQDTDTSPKESFVYHAPGMRGTSASDHLILRDKDSSTSWNAASDGTLEERIYYMSNWRGDVVEIIDDAGNRLESVRYSPYGVPFAMPAGDTDNDGDGDATDDAQFTTWINASAYDVRADMDLDGDVDAADQSTFNSNFNGDTLGRSSLSGDADTELGNRRGYASYEHDGVVNRVAHVRHRVLLTDLGRWSRRDPLGYVDGMGVYEYVGSRPIFSVDPSGLCWAACWGCASWFLGTGITFAGCIPSAGILCILGAILAGATIPLAIPACIGCLNCMAGLPAIIPIIPFPVQTDAECIGFALVELGLALDFCNMVWGPGDDFYPEAERIAALQRCRHSALVRYLKRVKECTS